MAFTLEILHRSYPAISRKPARQFVGGPRSEVARSIFELRAAMAWAASHD